MIRQPMKAYRTTPDLETLKFPLLASRKIDGIRCAVNESVALSNTLKPIPNAFIQNTLGHPALQGLDGELVVGNPSDPEVFNKTMSGVMAFGGRPDFRYLVFDDWSNLSLGFADRLRVADKKITYIHETFEGFRVYMIPHVLVQSLSALVDLERQYLDEGYEGMMVRSLTGLYKEGRSTVKEATLFKIKRFVDAEAVVIGVVEEYENTNVATVSETGYAKRSSADAGMIPKGTLGALVVRDTETGQEFKLGTGFTAIQRAEFWRQDLIGRIAVYKKFPYGEKDRPRLPTFKGFRDPLDISK